MMNINTKMFKRSQIISVVRKEIGGMRMVWSTHLLMQHMATGHWMQLTGLDKFLAHETQFTGGWSLQTGEGQSEE